MMARFGKVVTAMVTPFDDGGRISEPKLVNLIRHLEDNGTDTILVGGTTGESPTISRDEYIWLTRVVREIARPETKVMAGASTNNTARSVEMARIATDAGVNALLLVSPYYSKPPQEGLYAHFTAISEATPLPCVIYNIPGRTAVRVEGETMRRLSEVDNIVGVKEATGSLESVSEVRRLCGPDFDIYSGDDSLTLPMLSVGGCGVISVASHLVGTQIKEMITAFIDESNHHKAMDIHIKLWDLFKVLFITTNPVPVKYACNRIGLDVGSYRLPLIEPTDEQKSKIDEVLKGYGLIG
jgi:4-hydroxy-tetrahydrodipicolinate synthase